MATLLIPLVSTGNVSQLCVDLVLHSNSEEFGFVKQMDPVLLHSFLGPLDYVEGNRKPLYHDCKESSKRFTTPLELFYNQRLDLYVIQQRSPVITGYENQFFKEVIIPLIRQYNIAHVLVLDSAGASDSTVPFDAKNYQSQFTVARCDLDSQDSIAYQFETRLSLQGDEESVVNKVFRFDDSSFQQCFSVDQPVFKLCHHLLSQTDLPVKSICYLSKVVHEGDNSWDAFEMCEQLSKMIPGLIKDRLKTPVSWEGVYGGRAIPSGYDQGIYS